MVDGPDAIELPPVEGHVQFDHVTFGYDQETVVLKDIVLGMSTLKHSFLCKGHQNPLSVQAPGFYTVFCEISLL